MRDYTECKHGLMRRFCMDCTPHSQTESVANYEITESRNLVVAEKPARTCSAADALRQVAAALPQPFHLEQLVIAAWQADPKRFGLAGYPHPDARKVQNLVYGKNKLAWLVNQGEGLFRVAL